MQVWLSRVFFSWLDVSRDDRMAVTKEQRKRERERDNGVIGLFLSFGMTESKR